MDRIEGVPEGYRLGKFVRQLKNGRGEDVAIVELIPIERPEGDWASEFVGEDGNDDVYRIIPIEQPKQHLCECCGHTLKQHCIGPGSPCGYSFGTPESCQCQRFVYPEQPKQLEAVIGTVCECCGHWTDMIRVTIREKGAK